MTVLPVSFSSLLISVFFIGKFHECSCAKVNKLFKGVDSSIYGWMFLVASLKWCSPLQHITDAVLWPVLYHHRPFLLTSFFASSVVISHVAPCDITDAQIKLDILCPENRLSRKHWVLLVWSFFIKHVLLGFFSFSYLPPYPLLFHI